VGQASACRVTTVQYPRLAEHHYGGGSLPFVNNDANALEWRQLAN